RGVPMGAVEITPGDELVILNRGRGVTAGYPVIATVTGRSLDQLSQTVPGSPVSFQHTTQEEAVLDRKHQTIRLNNTIQRLAPLLIETEFNSPAGHSRQK